ncbi:hypothetical protein IID20_00680 [Patescibacteria group bacterium]|nr:hypothetical protein [Patescibacteria group bacterium]
MRKVCLFSGLIILLNIYNFAQAQTQDKFSIQVESTLWYTFGNDERLADQYEYSAIRLINIYRYSARYQPIIPKMPIKFSPIIRIKYKLTSNWKIELSGWQLKMLADQDGLVKTRWLSPPKGIRMWDYTILPLRNDKEESGRSPVWWGVANKLHFKTAEISTVRKLNHILEFIAGLKAIKVMNEKNIWQKQWVYAYRWMINSQGTFDWDNHVTLEENSQLKYLGIGPQIGLRGKTKYFEGFFKLSSLSGQAKYTGLWSDVDDIIIRKNGSEERFSSRFYDGQFPYNRKKVQTVHNMELGLKLTGQTKINQSMALDFGLGYFVSIFLDVPVAPRWSMPGNWIWREGSNWSTQTRNLTFAGIGINLGLSF